MAIGVKAHNDELVEKSNCTYATCCLVLQYTPDEVAILTMDCDREWSYVICAKEGKLKTTTTKTTTITESIIKSDGTKKSIISIAICAFIACLFLTIN